MWTNIFVGGALTELEPLFGFLFQEILTRWFTLKLWQTANTARRDPPLAPRN